MGDREQVLVANAGTLHLFRVAGQLQRHGLLKTCATTVFFGDHAFDYLPSVVRDRALRSTANRRCSDLNGSVRTLMLPELVRLAGGWLGNDRGEHLIEWRNRKFCQWAAEHCLDDVKLVWSFDTSSYELFSAAKQKGIVRVLDMSIAHPALGNDIMGDYAQQHPQLAACMDRPVPDTAIERRAAEIDLADHIVVGSSFVRDSLLRIGVAPEKISVNPYGVDVEMFRTAGGNRSQQKTGVRFLFVGWFSARKGIYDLIDAWKKSDLVESGCQLVLAGGTQDDLTCWNGPLPQGLVFSGRVAHAEVPALYRSADVFVFPSLFEGSARVILEAAASGLPVITTPAACEEHWVIDGESGFRVPSADPNLLAKKMRDLAENAVMRAEMGRRASEIAGRYSWTAYGDRCAAVCERLLNSRPC
jgi:glycosyltransferase involved in cell wall biosynthesis